ncbi:MAG TPA: hypothetical protein VGG42_05715 [Acidobacteriaceae bacterium]|jgi:hypothetical protein
MEAEDAAPEGQADEPAQRDQVTNLLAAMLSAQEHEAEAGDDDEEAELEVLPTLEKVIPGPELLGDGHGEQFNEGETKEEPAQVDTNLRSIREGETPGPEEDRVPLEHTVL